MALKIIAVKLCWIFTNIYSCKLTERRIFSKIGYITRFLNCETKYYVKKERGIMKTERKGSAKATN